MRFDLSDEEWAVIEPLPPKGGRGPKRVDDRYARWARRGIWKAIFDALIDRCADSLFFIDSSVVKAHRAATGAKGGNWRRISAAHAVAAQVKFTPLSTKVGVPVT